jgi:outer membrane protein assembly factor BamB
MEEASGSVVTSDSKGRVRSVVAETGAVEWTFERKGRLFGPPRRAGGSILVADVDGTLYAVDRYEGSLQWIYRPSNGGRLAGIASAITVVGRQVLFPTSGGLLVSLDSESGVVTDRSEESGWRADRPLGW